MKNFCQFLLLTALLLLAGCADSTKPDNEFHDAFKVDLLEHTGDTGNIIKNSYGMITDTLNCYYGADGTFYEYENNGIDAYFEGDWILLPWRHVSDPNTVSLEIYRFSYTSYQNQTPFSPERIKFIPFASNNADYFLDTFSGSQETIIDETWFYYIKTTNVYGETACSDTTGYCLANKPLLRQPADNAQFTLLDTLIFQWDLNSSDSTIKYRLLIFSEFYELIWFYNLLSDEAPLIDYTNLQGNDLPSGNYLWRVDAIIDRTSLLNIHGKTLEIHSGAESMERRFTLLE